MKSHIVADLYNVPTRVFEQILDDYDNVNRIITRLLAKYNATQLNYTYHKFDGFPGAFTCLYLLSESHLSIHTWPEENYVALDCFTCGDVDTESLVKDIVAWLESSEQHMVRMERGLKGGDMKLSEKKRKNHYNAVTELGDH